MKNIFFKIAILLGLLCVSLCSVGSCDNSGGRRLPTIIAMTRASDVILTGKVTNVGKTVSIVVEEVLKGEPTPAQIEVTPNQRLNHMFMELIVRKDDEALFFLKKGEIWTIIEEGWGTLDLKPENKTAIVEGIKQYLAFPSVEQEATDHAILKWATSDNIFLRKWSHSYFFWDLIKTKPQWKYKNQLLELVTASYPDTRREALQALSFMRVPEENIPVLIKATQDADDEVVLMAIRALSDYNTTDSNAALLALTKHRNLKIQKSAYTWLSHWRVAVIKADMVAFLDNPDPKTRAWAASAMTIWLRYNEADEIIPKLIKLLDDPVLEVQIAAAEELGGTGRATSALGPLMKILGQPDLNKDLERRTMEAISPNYLASPPTSRQVVDEKIKLVIDVLERGEWRASSSAISVLASNNSPEARAALERASKTHRLEDIRAEAALKLAPKPR